MRQGVKIELLPVFAGKFRDAFYILELFRLAIAIEHSVNHGAQLSIRVLRGLNAVGSSILAHRFEPHTRLRHRMTVNIDVHSAPPLLR